MAEDRRVLRRKTDGLFIFIDEVLRAKDGSITYTHVIPAENPQNATHIPEGSELDKHFMPYRRGGEEWRNPVEPIVFDV